jgi:hypothetical protein
MLWRIECYGWSLTLRGIERVAFPKSFHLVRQCTFLGFSGGMLIMLCLREDGFEAFSDSAGFGGNVT